LFVRLRRGRYKVNYAGPANDAGRKERAGSQRYKGERREAKADPSLRSG
jgi:hypothetical protein